MEPQRNPVGWDPADIDIDSFIHWDPAENECQSTIAMLLTCTGSANDYFLKSFNNQLVFKAIAIKVVVTPLRVGFEYVCNTDSVLCELLFPALHYLYFLNV